MTVMVNDVQAQLKTLTSATENKIRSKRKCYCWSCGIDYIHRSKTCLANNAGHQEEDNYKNRMVGRKRGANDSRGK